MNTAELRRLLELAAKAVGTPLEYIGGVAFFGRQAGWNPYLDDGDSRRLEVALFLTVAVRRHEIEVFDEHGDCLCSIPVNTENDDLAAATRLAALRAAAAIGKAMQQQGGES